MAMKNTAITGTITATADTPMNTSIHTVTTHTAACTTSSIS